jgi:hypothetical protein
MFTFPFDVGVKLSFLPSGKNINSECLRTGCLKRVLRPIKKLKKCSWRLCNDQLHNLPVQQILLGLSYLGG